MYSKHMVCLIRRCDRPQPHPLVHLAVSMNVSVSNCGVAPMRLDWENKPNIMKIYCRHPNFSRVCSRWIMPSYIWMLLRLLQPTLLRRLILILFLENKVRNCVMLVRCVEVRQQHLLLLRPLRPPDA